MYTDKDLDTAVEKGIFSQHSITAFKLSINKGKLDSLADEENFRFIGGFNDIFVVIACLLTLMSSTWVTYRVNPAMSMVLVSVLSWGLAEFFVLKRKLALTAIILLLSFISGTFGAVVAMYGTPSEYSLMSAAVIATLAAWLHWKRFNVPITIAAGVLVCVIFAVNLLISIAPSIKEVLVYPVFIGGLISFLIAMRWDSADRQRVTQQSDIAFWLHLLAAPLIVHPIFSELGILDNHPAPYSPWVVIVLYLMLTSLSLAIDRRAFMVSSLVYILFALTNMLKATGMANNSFAFAGVLIGASLLLLSGFWHTARYHLVSRLPPAIQSKLPFVR